MKPLKITRRGFGGAHMEHVLYNFDRIITPYQAKAIVVFVGGNDISAEKSVSRVASDYQRFITKKQQTLPNTDLWILSMKPSKLRWDRWHEMKALDSILRHFADQHAKINFVETGRSLLKADGTPDEVYLFDGLHLNAEGYKRWTRILKPLLLKAYPAPMET